MRIGIDISVLQGGSAQRGMGRYTLQQLNAVIDSADDSDLFFLFHQPFDPKPTLPQSITGRANVQVISLAFPEAVSLRGGKFTLEGERAYTEAIQRFIAGYQLDLFHLTCFDDSAYYYTPRAWSVCPLVMTLYDLIPLRMAEVFLTNPDLRASYMAALDLMKQSAASVAISHDARQNAVEALGIAPERITVAPPYATEDFHSSLETAAIPSIVRKIGGRYVYAISSFGDHKNLKRLIQGYAALPDALKSDVKLVVAAGTLRRDLPPDFAQWVESLGIEDRMVWLPRLSDDEIISLYQHAEVCSHVSLMEGFGLPILEAMQCATPVLTSNRGAMAEVAGDAALCVNPEDVSAITHGLAQLLTDDDLRSRLKAAGLEQAKTFNAERLAVHTRLAYAHITPRRLRVAMWSPLPPARSGISDYTAELVPYLAQYVDLVLYANPSARRDLFVGLPVVVRSYGEYEQYRSEPIDVHLYHMGNNLQFHEEIYFQLLREPGIVILHDLSLFGFFSYLARERTQEPIEKEVLYSEGESVVQKLKDIFQHWGASRENMDLLQLPMLRRITDHAQGIITHTPFGQELLQRYDQNMPVQFISLGTEILDTDTRTAASIRQQHGWDDSNIVFGVFGGINAIKRIHIVLDSFNIVSKSAPQARLAIIGREDDQTYIEQLQQAIKRYGLEGIVKFIGEVSLDNLKQHLQAIDVAINLRWPTAGETSAVMMRALGAGKPIIISDLPQWSYFPSTICRRVPLGSSEVSVLAQTMIEFCQNSLFLGQTEQDIRQYIAEEASFEVVSRRYYHLISQTITTSKTTATKRRESPTGVNILGDLHGDFGLSEVARGVVSSLRAAGIVTAYHEMVFDTSGRTTPFETPEMGLHHEINLFQMNAPQFDLSLEQLGKKPLYGRYNIGYWFYELPKLPESWAASAQELDEIWVATEFVKRAVESSIQKPVFVMPPPLELPPVSRVERSVFGIPENRFTFLYSFSTMASSARKNPFDLIEAFRRAVSQTAQPITLILKIQFFDNFPVLRDEIIRRAAGLPVVFITDNLSRTEMYSLIDLCDCYISLHRSEGLGLGMAEAMALGKPVIGTGWSGNIDFMDDENSYLVRCEVAPIRDEHHDFQETHKILYVPGSSVWAEPDIDHAAELMRHVVENPEDAAEKGRRAAETIREKYNPAILGQRIKAHLQTIDVSRGKYYNAQPEVAVTHHHSPLPLPSSFPSPSQAPTQVTIPGVDMHHLQAAYNGWNRERLRTTVRGFGGVINRIPVIGFIFRTIIRIRNLGKVWGAESVLLEALIREAEVAQAQRSENARHITELYRRSDEIYAIAGSLQAQLGQLNGSIAQQAEERLRGMADSLRDLNTGAQHTTRQMAELNSRYNDTLGQLNALRDATSGQFRAVNAAVESRLTSITQRLNDLHTDIQHLSEDNDGLEERTRLNTSQIRLMLLEMADSLAQRFTPAPLEVVRWLEATVPALAQSQRIDFNLHGMVDEGQMLALGDHLRGRLANIQPEVWYHFDHTNHWQGTALYDNARIKLVQGGFLVVVVNPSEATWPQPEGFTTAQVHTFTSRGETAHIAIYQKC